MGDGRKIDPLAGAPQAAPGSAQAAQQEQLVAALGNIFKTRLSGAFHWPYYVGALAALLSIPFSLAIGRRIGQDRGQHGAERGESPSAAADS
jgi:hypothetical protein